MRSLDWLLVMAVIVSPSLTLSTFATRVRGVAAWVEPRKRDGRLTATVRTFWRTTIKGSRIAGGRTCLMPRLTVWLSGAAQAEGLLLAVSARAMPPKPSPLEPLVRHYRNPHRTPEARAKHCGCL